MKKLLVPLLCALPFVGIALWFIAGKNAGSILPFGLMLICPLSHIFLMKHHHDQPHKKGGDMHET